MSNLLRPMTGVLTTAVFLGLGYSLYTQAQPEVAFLLLGLGTFRGIVLVRQIYFAFFVSDEDEDSEDD